jgi:excisionase family DNA binding protein
MERLLTVAEAAERLNTTPRHLRRLVFERRIAYRKLANYVRFHPDDLAEYAAPIGSRLPGRRVAGSGWLAAGGRWWATSRTCAARRGAGSPQVAGALPRPVRAGAVLELRPQGRR